jgi:hypothetical protein
MPPLESNPKIENTRAGIEPMTCVKSDNHICHRIIKDGVTSLQQLMAVASTFGAVLGWHLIVWLRLCLAVECLACMVLRFCYFEHFALVADGEGAVMHESA